jgi:hypothetical protein
VLLALKLLLLVQQKRRLLSCGSCWQLHLLQWVVLQVLKLLLLLVQLRLRWLSCGSC